ncbi:hypothetical protein BC936DRAFT_148890 [Jimgerdemannia flammicorona]|uniref:Uncharacterized protein n=1 Tax=Jimgerdemannia flammicorona TaxID=994334 RepID=A0A433D237_9FUNG|nr:hypothetical protein BC936DRAFT_148890 [Jimgerdemannia flammicorona]
MLSASSSSMAMSRLNVALSSSALAIRSKTGPSSSDAASLTTGSSSAAWLESSSSSSNPLYFESSVDASSTSLGATSLLGASPLLHGLDDDEFEVNADINPITSETHSPPTWMVPSGLSATELIRGPKSISSAHPSRFGIIRVGDGVRCLPWIKKADWEYLQASTNYHKHPISLSAQQFFNDLLHIILYLFLIILHGGCEYSIVNCKANAVSTLIY